MDPRIPNVRLLEAADMNHDTLLRLALDDGANPNIKGEDGLTPLLFVLRHGNEELANLLVEYGADVDKESSEGLTSLHYAARKGLGGFVNFLLEHGFDINRRDKFGKTAFDYAESNKTEEVVAILQKINPSALVKSAARHTSEDEDKEEDNKEEEEENINKWGGRKSNINKSRSKRNKSRSNRNRNNYRGGGEIVGIYRGPANFDQDNGNRVVPGEKYYFYEYPNDQGLVYVAVDWFYGDNPDRVYRTRAGMDSLGVPRSYFEVEGETMYKAAERHTATHDDHIKEGEYISKSGGRKSNINRTRSKINKSRSNKNISRLNRNNYRGGGIEGIYKGPADFDYANRVVPGEKYIFNETDDAGLVYIHVNWDYGPNPGDLYRTHSGMDTIAIPRSYFYVEGETMDKFAGRHIATHDDHIKEEIEENINKSGGRKSNKNISRLNKNRSRSSYKR
jgi:hypothetical protein